MENILSMLIFFPAAAAVVGFLIHKDSMRQFGVVVTLKEMNGVNRIDDFIKLCMVRGWLVNRIDIQNQIDVYSKAEEEIEFE